MRVRRPAREKTPTGAAGRHRGAGLAGRTLLVIAILFGIQLVVTGMFRFVSAFALDNLSGGGPFLMARCRTGTRPAAAGPS